VPTIVVEVMPKAELLDPAGKAVTQALHRLGHSRIGEVRLGKRFELLIDGEVDADLLAQVEEVAAEMLANGVIEDVISVRVHGADGSDVADGAGVAGETR